MYAPAGFGSREIAALEDLREVGGSGLDLQLTLLALGQPGDFGGIDAARGESPLLAESRSWVSRTPFVPTRHPKTTRAGVPKLDPASGQQIGSPEHELLRLLGLAGFPEPAAVEPVSFTEIAGERVGWSSFRRARTCGDGRREGSAGYGFRNVRHIDSRPEKGAFQRQLDRLLRAADHHIPGLFLLQILRFLQDDGGPVDHPFQSRLGVHGSATSSGVDERDASDGPERSQNQKFPMNFRSAPLLSSSSPTSAQHLLQEPVPVVQQDGLLGHIQI